MLWHEQGEDIGQRMLALSTYLGHSKAQILERANARGDTTAAIKAARGFGIDRSMRI